MKCQHQKWRLNPMCLTSPINFLETSHKHRFLNFFALKFVFCIFIFFILKYFKYGKVYSSTSTHRFNNVLTFSHIIPCFKYPYLNIGTVSVLCWPSYWLFSLILLCCSLPDINSPSNTHIWVSPNSFIKFLYSCNACNESAVLTKYIPKDLASLEVKSY